MQDSNPSAKEPVEQSSDHATGDSDLVRCPSCSVAGLPERIAMHECRQTRQTDHDSTVQSTASSPRSNATPKQHTSCTDGGHHEPTVAAPLGQVVGGMSLGNGETIACQKCQTTLQAGHLIILALTQSHEQARWSAEGWYCSSCAPTVIASTASTTAWYAVGHLALRSVVSQQRHVTCLHNPTILSSPVTDTSARQVPNCRRARTNNPTDLSTLSTETDRTDIDGGNSR